MNITVDTNVLVRLVLGDDNMQGAAALAALENASLVAISVHSLCELVWVLGGRLDVRRTEIAAIVRTLTDARNVVVDRPAVDAGLAALEAGGDFADGVIAYDGRSLGGEVFVSFDKKAVKLVEEQGKPASLLS